ncbi:hypothetical protein ANN_21204 [Periplaneta americana]|uniref:Uncharacterized protein n=1 Tax=Periplaneta americana TaxID=6978 RepID=A0ABQ8SEP0_PERAM|nr:hypothetical protein ANN_21204 [Periplaneta americana]
MGWFLSAEWNMIKSCGLVPFSRMERDQIIRTERDQIMWLVPFSRMENVLKSCGLVPFSRMERDQIIRTERDQIMWLVPFSRMENVLKSCGLVPFSRMERDQIIRMKQDQIMWVGSFQQNGTGSNHVSWFLSAEWNRIKSCGLVPFSRMERDQIMWVGSFQQNGQRTAPGLPRQTSLQTPMISNLSASSDRPPEYAYPELPPISSPPPTYEVAMGKRLGASKPSHISIVNPRLTDGPSCLSSCLNQVPTADTGSVSVRLIAYVTELCTVSVGQEWGRVVKLHQTVLADSEISRGQPIRGGPPAWGLGEGLTTHHRKKQLVTKPNNKPRNGTDSPATKYMIMSRDQNIVRNGTIKTGDLSFEEVEKFKYLGATVTNINDTREEIKRRINMRNACYYSVEKLLSSSLLSKNLKVRIYKTVLLPVVLYGCETWNLTLREKQRLRFFENKVLMKIFGAKRDEVTGEWRKLHNAELHALYPSPDIMRNIKSRHGAPSQLRGVPSTALAAAAIGGQLDAAASPTPQSHDAVEEPVAAAALVAASHIATAGVSYHVCIADTAPAGPTAELLQLLQVQVQRRDFKIVNVIESEVETAINQFVAYSLALDESTDRNDKAHLAIFIRGVNEHFTVYECLLDVITKYNWRRSFPGTERHHRKEEVEFAMACVATDGAPAS